MICYTSTLSRYTLGMSLGLHLELRKTAIAKALYAL